MTRLQLFFFFLFAIAVTYTGALAGSAFADDITGIMELYYSHTHSKTDNGNGNVSSTNTDDFFQQYTLTLTKMLYPNLRLFASGIFQQDMTTTRADTGETESRTTNIQPLISLTLNTPTFIAAATYNKIQITTNASGSPSQTVINDNYNGLLGFRPEGLPTLDITVQRTDTYDKEHIFQDTLVDRLLVNSRFTPVKNLDLGYQFNYNDSKDKLHDTDTTQITDTGRFSYAQTFFNDRVRLYADGNVSLLETSATIGAAGTSGIQFPQSAVSGLYAADSTADSPFGVDVPPHTPANDAMKSTPFLINGGDFLSNVGKLNIGFPQTNPSDIDPRDVGLAFAQPTELNAIYVTVNQNINTIAASYSWDVYTSNDINIGQGVSPSATQQWTLYQQAATFIFSQIDNTFRITFQKTTAQFFKVVTRPLPVPAAVPGVDVNNILITQIQAFDTASSGAGTNKTSTTSQNYDLDVRAKILDRPVLYYDLTSNYSSTSNSGSGFAVGQPSLMRYIISNGLSGAYRFSRVFSTSARVAREDSDGPEGTGVAYVYNASLTAVPLGTLSHSLVFSSRQERLAGEPDDTTSIFLTNLAELYKGINAALSGGLSWATSPTSQENVSQTLTFTLGVVPHKALTINGDFLWSSSNSTGGGVPDVKTTTQRSDISVTYTPFSTLTLIASYGMFSGVNTSTNTLVNYGVNWSPFPDGTLLFNFNYMQNLESLNSLKDTTIVPSLRWNISRYAYMTFSYLDYKTESVVTNVSQRTSQETLSTSLNVTF